MRILKTLSFLLPLLLATSCSMKVGTCSDDWYVTGYFTPIESEYPRQQHHTIKVDKTDHQSFPSAFLKAVKMEGWGKTRKGWYLGYYNSRWHRSDRPLGSNGRPLRTGSIAVDPRLFNSGAKLKIPTMPGRMKEQVFVADDRGSAIKAWRIDVYTGEGKQAEKVTWNITSKHHTVCLLRSG